MAFELIDAIRYAFHDHFYHERDEYPDFDIDSKAKIAYSVIFEKNVEVNGPTKYCTKSPHILKFTWHSGELKITSGYETIIHHRCDTTLDEKIAKFFPYPRN